MENVIVKMGLPGFRFHPTEEELIGFYLKNFVLGKRLCFDIIGFLNIYHYNPWDLPALAKINGEREWYFFVPRDKKNGHGGRPNRTTENGFWKATGSDRQIRSLTDPKKILGLRKTLVFYLGRAPRGSKTDWVMNEYRLPNSSSFSKIQDEIVLCKIYRKATSLKVLEQRAAVEEESRISNLTQYSLSSPQTQESSLSYNSQLNPGITQMPLNDNIVVKAEEAAFSEGLETKAAALPVNLTGPQVPKLDMDWTVLDPLHGAQLRSPWLDNWNACGTQVVMKSFFDM